MFVQSGLGTERDMYCKIRTFNSIAKFGITKKIN